MSAWNVSFADYEQFFSARSKVSAGFVEFDWFSIVSGKVLRFSETKKLEFSRRNLLGKAFFRFSKMRGANLFSKCSTRQISFNKLIKLIQSFCLLQFSK